MPGGRRRWLPAAAGVIVAAALAGQVGLATALISLLVIAAGLSRAPRRARRRGAAVCGGLAAALLAAEGLCRVLTPDAPPWLPTVPNQRCRFEGLTIPGCPPTARFTTNALGLRGDPPPEGTGAWRLLCVGGSTTQCMFLDDDLTWPALLQGRLRAGGLPAWVGNAGINGHSTRGNLLVVERVAPLARPDAIVVLCGVNDLVLSLSAAKRARGNRYDEHATTPGAGPRLLQVLRRAWRVHVAGDYVMTAVTWDQRVPRAGRPFTPLPADVRPLLASLGEFRANVRRMIELARAARTPILFLTQPLRFDDRPGSEGHGRAVDEAWAASDELVLDAAGFWRLMHVFNQELQAVCAAEGVPCHDLAAEVPRSPDLFYDIAHFTAAGSALVAERVHAAVSRHLLPPRGR